VDENHDEPRTQALWGNLMGGGSGVEWYFGYEFPHMDINLEDFRSRDRMWDQTRYALEFFQQHLPFWEMEPDNERASGAEARVLAKGDEIVAVYLPNGGNVSVRLGPGACTVEWYNPRTGGALKPGRKLQGGGIREIGHPPEEPEKDWAAVLRSR